MQLSSNLRFVKSRLGACRSIISYSQTVFDGKTGITVQGDLKGIDITTSNNVKIGMKSSLLTNVDLKYIRGSSLNSKNGLLGNFGVGSVTKVGPNVDNVAVKDNVFVYCPDGAWATDIVTPAHYVSTIKSSLPNSILTQFPIALSAWALMSQFVALNLKDKVIVDSITTPMGKLFVEFGVEFGVEVVEFKPFKKDDSVKPPKAGLVLCSQAGLVKDMIKQVSSNGTLVLYESMGTDTMQTISDVSPIQVPYSAAIFSNISLSGFDLNQWIFTNPDKFRKGCNVVEGLLQKNKLTLTSPKNKIVLDANINNNLELHGVTLVEIPVSK